MILIRNERSERGHWSGFEPGTNIGYVVNGNLADSPAGVLDVIRTSIFDRESEQVNPDTGEIRITRWYGNFFDATKYTQGEITEVKGRKAAVTQVKVTYVD